jgi:sulfur carrier protein ThiS adenylyltransferase
VEQHWEMTELGKSIDSAAIEELLNRATVGIAGIGGIGSHLAVLLVRAGVNNLTLVDYDTVEHGNLKRQYYFIDQVGQKKVDALNNTLKRINPHINCYSYDVKVTEDNITQLFSHSDIIVEALDKACVKKMFIEHCIKLFPGKKIVGVSGIAGINDCELISTEKISENLFIVGDFVSEITPPINLISTRVCAAASMQAHLVVQLILKLK